MYFKEFKLGLGIWLYSQERLLAENLGSIPRTHPLLTTSNFSPKGLRPLVWSLWAAHTHTRDMYMQAEH